MKNKYLKNLLKTVIWPIIFVIGQFFIRYIFVAIFNSKEKGNMTNSEFLEYIKSVEYNDKLNNYIDSKTLLIIAISMVIFIPIFYNVFKKYKQKNNFKIKNIFIPILFGVSISLIYNITLFSINNVFNFTTKFEPSTLSILVQLIATGICGPILEEFVFRGIVYNKLKEFNKPMTAIVLCSVLFGIMHVDIIDAIYAFGISFILIYLYEKYKTLYSSILMHITLNSTIILMFNLITKNYLVFNIYLLIVSITILLILKKFIKKDV